MVTETKVKSGGSWRDIVLPEIEVGGVGRPLVTIEVKLSGTWQTVFAAAAGTVTVSGETIVGATSSGTARAGVIFRANGKVAKTVNGTESQIDASTDWIIPNDEATSLYEVRYTGGTETWTVKAANQDTWTDLSTDREWRVENNVGDITANIVTFEIRFNGGSVLDSATYTCRADNR